MGVLIPFLKYYFPHSRVVPILIDVNADAARLQRLRDVLGLVRRIRRRCCCSAWISLMTLWLPLRMLETNKHER